MTQVTPILLLGAGRMGGALMEGWGRTGAFLISDLIVRDPHPPQAVQLSGADVNPPDGDLARARTVLMAVKPQLWMEVAAALAPHLAPDAVILSIAAGVPLADLSLGFGGRRVARIMPTTAVAIGRGVASVFAPDPEAQARAHALFAPVATVVDIDDEGLMHAATGVSGSAPAYLYAFIEALEAAGVTAGLSAGVARRLARATIAGSAALLDATGEDPAELRRQVTSPGGTTQAALQVLMSPSAGLGPLLDQAVAACVRRSRQLAG